VPEEQATELAERHGLVTHLTSLLLVDEAGEMQEGLPALRKVALPSPATGVVPMAARCLELPLAARASVTDHGVLFDLSESAFFDKANQGAPQPHIVRLAHALDWNADPARLAVGDVDALVTKRQDDQEWFEQMFAALLVRREVEELAYELGMSALQVVILMLAYVVRDKNRTADRLLRAEGLGGNLEKLRRLVLVVQ
jgi:hypothetical protein